MWRDGLRESAAETKTTTAPVVGVDEDGLFPPISPFEDKTSQSRPTKKSTRLGRGIASTFPPDVLARLLPALQRVGIKYGSGDPPPIPLNVYLAQLLMRFGFPANLQLSDVFSSSAPTASSQLSSSSAPSLSSSLVELPSRHVSQVSRLYEKYGGDDEVDRGASSSEDEDEVREEDLVVDDDVADVGEEEEVEADLTMIEDVESVEDILGTEGSEDGSDEGEGIVGVVGSNEEEDEDFVVVDESDDGSADGAEVILDDDGEEDLLSDDDEDLLFESDYAQEMIDEVSPQSEEDALRLLELRREEVLQAIRNLDVDFGLPLSSLVVLKTLRLANDALRGLTIEQVDSSEMKEEEEVIDKLSRTLLPFRNALPKLALAHLVVIPREAEAETVDESEESFVRSVLDLLQKKLFAGTQRSREVFKSTLLAELRSEIEMGEEEDTRFSTKEEFFEWMNRTLGRVAVEYDSITQTWVRLPSEGEEEAEIEIESGPMRWIERVLGFSKPFCLLGAETVGTLEDEDPDFAEFLRGIAEIATPPAIGISISSFPEKIRESLLRSVRSIGKIDSDSDEEWFPVRSMDLRREDFLSAVLETLCASSSISGGFRCQRKGIVVKGASGASSVFVVRQSLCSDVAVEDELSLSTTEDQQQSSDVVEIQTRKLLDSDSDSDSGDQQSEIVMMLKFPELDNACLSSIHLRSAGDFGDQFAQGLKTIGKIVQQAISRLSMLEEVEKLSQQASRWISAVMGKRTVFCQILPTGGAGGDNGTWWHRDIDEEEEEGLSLIYQNERSSGFDHPESEERFKQQLPTSSPSPDDESVTDDLATCVLRVVDGHPCGIFSVESREGKSFTPQEKERIRRTFKMLKDSVVEVSDLSASSPLSVEGTFAIDADLAGTSLAKSTCFIKRLLIHLRHELDQMTSSHLKELVGYRIPPRNVWRIVKASLYLFGKTKRQLANWDLTRQILRKFKIFERLSRYDPTRKQPKMRFVNIGIILKHLTYERMGKVSLPAKLLYAYLVVVMDLRRLSVRLRKMAVAEKRAVKANDEEEAQAEEEVEVEGEEGEGEFLEAVPDADELEEEEDDDDDEMMMDEVVVSEDQEFEVEGEGEDEDESEEFGESFEPVVEDDDGDVLSVEDEYDEDEDEVVSDPPSESDDFSLSSVPEIESTVFGSGDPDASDSEEAGD